MLHLLLETNLTEEQKDYGDTMKRSADSLLRIIDDVLDFRYTLMIFIFLLFFFFFLHIYLLSYFSEKGG